MRNNANLCLLARKRQGRFILFYFILFYFILFYFILFYFILVYFSLFYFILFYFFASKEGYPIVRQLEPPPVT